MTIAQFDTAFRAFARRRPFRPFVIEFTSGHQAWIRHPEAVRREGELYAMRSPDAGSIVFAAESVSRLLDVPPTPTA